jgi:protease-4
MAEESSPEPRTPHSTTSAAPVEAGHDPSLARAMLEIVREMGEQRKALQSEHALATAERRSERRWRMLFQALFFGAPVLLGILYFLFFLNTTGFRWGPLTSVVGVVRIDGEIAANKVASADNVISVLEEAFANRQVKAVVLSIDSPGGAPVEAERIYSAIGSLRKKHEKPVYAVISNLGASAAYMIALHADKIVAGKYSLVGSVGAAMAPWQLDRAIARLDVSQRVYASGSLKSFLNPFTPVTPEADAKAKKLVGQLGGVFVKELQTARGKRLKQGVNYGTGEIWGGLEAKEIGLVDEIGTLDEVIASTWGLKAYDFGPQRQGMGLLHSCPKQK